MDILPNLINNIVQIRQERQRQERLVTRRRPRNFNIRLSFDSLLEVEIHRQFRLNKRAILELYSKIERDIESSTQRSQAVTGLTKMLSVLYFMASGLFQHVSSARFGISQPSFCRFLKIVLKSMLKVVNDYIHFPETNEEIRLMKEQFYTIAGFPNVIGAIDCTHVALVPPADSEHIYRNRKMYRSINVQVVVGPKLQILDIVPNFPGSCHDSFILQGTELYRRFQRGDYGESILLGDNGYRLSRWLMTPFLNPRSSAEQRYNHAHKKTRSIVERTFGILKSRFRCLDVSGGALLYKPKTVCRIIIACAILHNIANVHNLETPLAEDLREEIQINLDPNFPADNAGQLLRQQITTDFFGPP